VDSVNAVVGQYAVVGLIVVVVVVGLVVD